MQSDVQSSVTTTSGDGGSMSLTGDAALIAALRKIVGKSHVITGAERTRRFCTGFRFGHGPAVAVVRPGSLVEQWRVLKACIAANKIVIMQAANTGLTGWVDPGWRGLRSRRRFDQHHASYWHPSHQPWAAGGVPAGSVALSA
jgi:FAD/FMN-containing dehydrogenase